MTKKDLNHEYRIPFRVRSYEVNSRQTASIATICDYFQEAAGVHANHLQFDISQLYEKGLTWVLYKMHVKAERLPSRWEDLEVVTRPSSGDGIRAFRDYELLDAEGEQIAVGISQWMVLDVHTRRAVRMPDEVLKMGIKQENHTLPPDKSPVKGPDDQDGDLITVVGRHDLDINKHVNNVSYIRWLSGYIPESEIDGHECVEAEVQFRLETTLGDRIKHSIEKEENTKEQFRFRHTLFKGEGRKPIASAITCWRPFSS